MSKFETLKCYESSNKQYGVRMRNQELQYLHKLCEKSHPYETGGILIGRYSDNLKWAEVTDVTGAPSNSRHALWSFVRNTQGIVNRLKQAWKKQQYYLGECHYHPNASPRPSGLDVRTMYELSENKDLHCPEPILLIIGGSPLNWYHYIGVYAEKTEIELHETNIH